MRTTHIQLVGWGAAFAGLLLSAWQGQAAIVNAASVSRADVGTAVALAKDGDTVNVPAGNATWATTLEITKNITLQGAGEGKTVITENLSRTLSPPLINVNLSHDPPATDYSFRLSGFTFKSASGTRPYPSDHAFIMITGKSSYVANPTTAQPAPLVLGCVSRVRLDYLTWDNLNGLSLVVDSILGVADHITQITSTSTYASYPIKVFHRNWTPATYKGAVLTTLAAKGFGSWADDPYWGTNKFFFFEDCNFTVPDTTNVADDEGGARVVFRHCTFNGGGGLATHGMEGRTEPGIKQQEVYDNYFITSRLFAQHRSGSALYFNNKSTAMTKGMGFGIYRQTRTEENWGGADGTNRYDNNGTLVYSGTVTSYSGQDSITDSAKANFDAIDLTDGSLYSVNDLDDPAAGATFDPGWKYKHASVSAVNGKTLTLNSEGGTGTYGVYSAEWRVGHRYEVRKVLAAYGQPGQGKGNLLNTVTDVNSYVTYTYPATSGPKATYPMAGFPLEPCYAWNNTDNTYGYLNFYIVAGSNTSIKAGRDCFSLSERTVATHQVGYPPQSYTRATNSYPGVGPNGTAPYTPYTYPHPLTAPGDSSPSAPQNLQIKP